jgi:SAM-dependent methyltransferase/uncharacterized membrane protein YbhN (UPF0104 family)
VAGSGRWVAFGIPIALGAAAAALWVRFAGGGDLAAALGQAHPAAFGGMLSLTAAWLFLRFVRWQFLLRRVGVRLPVRASLSVYLAALPGTATPAYVGELARGVFVRRRFGTPLRLTASVLVLERLYDVAALGLLAGAFAPGRRGMLVGAVFALAAPSMAGALLPLARRAGLGEAAIARLRTSGTVGPALLLSLLAWGAASLLVAGAAAALRVAVGPAEGAWVFAHATLLGAVTLAPAGMGATGSVAILELGGLGVSLASGVAVVSLVRLTSTGAALALGCAFLWRETRGRPSAPPAHAAAHFDEIAAEYNAQWSPHVWDLLLKRKLDLIDDAIGRGAGRDAVGLDLGCGLGLQVAEMTRRGHRVIGLDPSVGLLRGGRSRGFELLAGDALDLPFADGTFDFVYTIGVLHHLPGPAAQARAFGEVARVLKPGGVFVVHETNPRNPLFRFYMGYLFPMLRRIDEGTEWWIDPRHAMAPRFFAREAVRYFTWLPDFTPRAFMGLALAAERLLERGPLRGYSAHFMIVLRRLAEPAGLAVAGPPAAARVWRR